MVLFSMAHSFTLLPIPNKTFISKIIIWFMSSDFYYFLFSTRLFFPHLPGLIYKMRNYLQYCTLLWSYPHHLMCESIQVLMWITRKDFFFYCHGAVKFAFEIACCHKIHSCKFPAVWIRPMINLQLSIYVEALIAFFFLQIEMFGMNWFREVDKEI